MDYETILYSRNNGILTVMLNRPSRLNAVTPRMVAELLDAIDRADRDDDVRVVVFTGAGRAFRAGSDMMEPHDAAAPDPGVDGHRDGGGLVTLRLFDCLKPTIAACNGLAR